MSLGHMNTRAQVQTIGGVAMFYLVVTALEMAWWLGVLAAIYSILTLGIAATLGDYFHHGSWEKALNPPTMRERRDKTPNEFGDGNQ